MTNAAGGRTVIEPAGRLPTHSRENQVTRPRVRAWFTACLVLLGAANAVAGALSGDITRGDWSSNRVLDDANRLTVVRLHAALDLPLRETLRLAADGWVDSEGEPGRARTEELREFYLQIRPLPCAPSLGRKVVAWGKTDVITPTDRISPTNFRRMTPDIDEQRLGVTGLHANCAIGPGRLQMHLLDRFRFNKLPFAAKPGIRIEEPKLRLRSSYAARYDLLHPLADAGIGMAEGYDLFPTLGLRSASADGLQLVLTPTRTRMIGGDIALTRGPLVLRGEVAWVGVVKEDAPPVPGLAFTANRSSQVQAVAQVEANFLDRESLTLQVFLKQSLDDIPVEANPQRAAVQRLQGLLSNEVDPQQWGITLRYTVPVYESRGNLEVLGIWSLPQREVLLRGRFTYDLSTAWRVSTGFDYFRGPPASFLGNLEANSAAFAEIRFGW